MLFVLFGFLVAFLIYTYMYMYMYYKVPKKERWERVQTAMAYKTKIMPIMLKFGEIL